MILKNGMGQKTVRAIALYLQSEAARDLKKLLLKNPRPQSNKLNPIKFNHVFLQLYLRNQQLYNLNSLTVSQFSLDSHSLRFLGQAVCSLKNLRMLDISANGLKEQDLATFLYMIKNDN